MEEREYSDETHALILEMEKVNLRQEYIFDKEKIIELLKEVHTIAGIDMKPIVLCDSIFDENFIWAARAAGAAVAVRAAWAARAAGAAWAAWAARAAGAARAAWAARAARAAWAARAAGVDYDFDYFIFEKEFLMKNK